jgi:hypothetical protein
VRYVSKNNANVARLELLATLFPDCSIVVPVREPWAHIGSLHAQHHRFTEIHRRDPFALQYMNWLGHHEFGASLKPIDFGGWLARAPARDPETLEFWARYWLAWATAMLECRVERVALFDYERACADPEHALSSLADSSGLGESAALRAGVARFRAAERQATVADAVSSELRARVAEVYAALRARAR